MEVGIENGINEEPETGVLFLISEDEADQGRVNFQKRNDTARERGRNGVGSIHLRVKLISEKENIR